MRIQKCHGGQILVLRGYDIYPKVDSPLVSLINGIGLDRKSPNSLIQSMVIGVVTPVTNAGEVYRDFEHYEEGDSPIVRGWSGRGRAFVGNGQQLRLISNYPGKGAQPHILRADEDVLIGDFELDDPGALTMFKRTLWDHQILAKR